MASVGSSVTCSSSTLALWVGMADQATSGRGSNVLVDWCLQQAVTLAYFQQAAAYAGASGAIYFLRLTARTGHCLLIPTPTPPMTLNSHLMGVS